MEMLTCIATMPIPASTEEGVLPIGIYEVNLEDVGERFGGPTIRRQTLFTGLSRYVERLRRLAIVQEMIINGSFVTSKRLPTDIDIIVVYRNDHDPASALTEEERDLIDVTRVKAVFGFDVFPLPPGSQTREELIRIFQRGTRPTDIPKGILRLVL